MNAATTHRKRSFLARNRGALVIASVVIAVTAVLGYLLIDAMEVPPEKTQKVVQQVNIIRPPPPPPEPEREPPPEPEPEDLIEPEPEQVVDSDEPPPGDLLGLDADGVAGGDGFGLVARKGGRDLLGIGSDEQYRWYGQVLKRDLIGRLTEIRDLRRDRYSVDVRLWLSPDGRIQRFQVGNSTGDRGLDRDLVTALESLDRVSEMPPAGLPQPVRLRIVSRI